MTRKEKNTNRRSPRDSTNSVFSSNQDSSHSTSQSAGPASFPKGTTPRQAFTLIEILVVIVIITILAAIGVGLGIKFYSAGRDEQTKTTLKIIMNAVHDFHEQTGAYPIQHDPTNYNFRIRIRKTDSSGNDLPSYTRFVEKIKDLDSNAFEKPTSSFQTHVSGNLYDMTFNFIDADGRPLQFFPVGGLGRTPILLSPGEDGKSYFDDGSAAQKDAWGKDDIRSDKIK